MKKHKNVPPTQEKQSDYMLPYGFVGVLVVVGLTCLGLGSRHYTNSSTNVVEGTIADRTVTSAEHSTFPGERDVISNRVAPNNVKVIHNLTVSESNTVVILGPIEENAASIAQEITRKAASNKKVNVLINSPGGSILDGVLIISAIQAANVEVDTICLQICASMAAIIFEYGTKRYMVDRSTLMFHEAAGGLQGSFNHMQSEFTYFNRLFTKMDVEIALRAKKNPEEFRAKLGNEIWLDAEDAMKESFSDGIVNININSLSDGSFSNLSQTRKFLDKFRVMSQ